MGTQPKGQPSQPAPAPSDFSASKTVSASAARACPRAAHPGKEELPSALLSKHPPHPPGASYEGHPSLSVTVSHHPVVRRWQWLNCFPFTWSGTETQRRALTGPRSPGRQVPGPAAAADIPWRLLQAPPGHTFRWKLKKSFPTETQAPSRAPSFEPAQLTAPPRQGSFHGTQPPAGTCPLQKKAWGPHPRDAEQASQIPSSGEAETATPTSWISAAGRLPSFTDRLAQVPSLTEPYPAGCGGILHLLARGQPWADAGHDPCLPGAYQKPHTAHQATGTPSAALGQQKQHPEAHQTCRVSGPHVPPHDSESPGSSPGICSEKLAGRFLLCSFIWGTPVQTRRPSPPSLFETANQPQDMAPRPSSCFVFLQSCLTLSDNPLYSLRTFTTSHTDTELLRVAI